MKEIVWRCTERRSWCPLAMVMAKVMPYQSMVVRKWLDKSSFGSETAAMVRKEFPSVFELKKDFTNVRF